MFKENIECFDYWWFKHEYTIKLNGGIFYEKTL